MARLGQIGSMAESRRVAERLRDDDTDVRQFATAALWQIWSRSGDAAIDRLFGKVLFFLDEERASPTDCNEVIKRSSRHFGAWSVSWHSSHNPVGRSQDALRHTGNASLFYCFAAAWGLFTFRGPDASCEQALSSRRQRAHHRAAAHLPAPR